MRFISMFTFITAGKWHIYIVQVYSSDKQPRCLSLQNVHILLHLIINVLFNRYTSWQTHTGAQVISDSWLHLTGFISAFLLIQVCSFKKKNCINYTYYYCKKIHLYGISAILMPTTARTKLAVYCAIKMICTQHGLQSTAN